jgi:oligosaccharide 4-alpha-D-glucosyltransferase
LKSVSVALPQGTWFEYFTQNENTPSKRYQGNKTINLATSLETLPVLVRAGSFIPMIDDIQSTQDYDASKLTLHYYADKSVSSAEYEMYEDDGKTYQAIEKGLYELLNFTAKQNEHQLSISLYRNNQSNIKNLLFTNVLKAQANPRGYTEMPKSRQMNLIIHNITKQPKQIVLGKKVINNAAWDTNNKTLTLNFTWQHQPLTLEIQ